MNQLKTGIIAIAFLALPLSSFRGAAEAEQTAQIKWHSIAEAQQLAKKSPRKIYIDMYTDWCGWCKVMDEKTFTDAKIIQRLNSDFYAVKFDAEGKEDVVFKDKTFKFVAQGGRGYHELAATLMNGQLSYPTSVFLDEELNLITPLPGYLTPERMDPVLEFIGKNHYKTTPWETFLANRK